MCNFYVMYYVKQGEPLKTQYCFSYGAPLYYWNKPETGLTNIPDREASILHDDKEKTHKNEGVHSSSN